MSAAKPAALGSVALRNAVRYLESIGLQVYGPIVDFTDGEITSPGGYTDYSAADVIKYRTCFELHGLWRYEEEDS